MLVYRPSADAPFRLWLPMESKQVLYSPEMEYWLEQWEERHGRVSGRRFDLQVCEQAKLIDQVTGVRALRDYQPDRPTESDYQRFLAPPEDLAGWATAAAATPLPEPPARLALSDVELVFPQVVGQRTLARAAIALPTPSGAEPYVDPDKEDAKPELRLTVDAVVEQNGQLFDEFKARYRLDPPGDGEPVSLVLERPLRPDHDYLLRLRIRDEVGGAQVDVARGFAVPREATPEADLKPAPGAVQSLDLQLGSEKLAGKDSLILVPPEGEVVFGLWRAEALVTGDRIAKVAFFLDGKAQLSRSRRPFDAELRLAELPTQQVVRAEGYDSAGALVAADEVVLNQLRGAFAVEIVEPKRGFTGTGKVTARVEVTVPEERHVERVELRLNNELVATLEKPPWVADVEVPSGEEITYLSAVAFLDDGRSAESVRFLNAPRFLEQVEVRLVELYVAVVDHDGRPVTGVGQDDFEVFEDGRKQEIRKFELVENLPLAVGVTIDTSGSMVPNIAEAQRAGKAFLEKVMTPRDRCFVLSFAAAPVLHDAPHRRRRGLSLRPRPAAGGGLHRAARRGGHQPLLLPRPARPEGADRPLRRRRHLVDDRLPGGPRVRPPQRGGDLPGGSGGDRAVVQRPRQAAEPGRGDRRQGVLHQQGRRADGGLRRDREGAAQPLLHRLRGERRGQAGRGQVPRGDGEAEDPRADGADHPRVLPVSARARVAGVLAGCARQRLAPLGRQAPVSQRLAPLGRQAPVISAANAAGAPGAGLISAASAAGAPGAPIAHLEVSFSAFNHGYSVPGATMAPVVQGALTVRLSSPENALVVKSNQLRLDALGDGTQRAEWTVEFHGRGKLNADFDFAGAPGRFEDEVVIPPQTRTVVGRVRLAAATAPTK